MTLLRLPRLAVAASVALVTLATVAPSTARADEQSIIKSPGEHPHYVFEAEPHAIIGFAPPFENNLGVGFRGTFHIADGFVKSINDSVGVGFGLDLAPGNATYVLVPIVLQWNFWLSTHWSVFGEPGLAITSGRGPTFDPFVFYAGGRFHFSERISLTMRVGYPDFSVGVSFFL